MVGMRSDEEKRTIGHQQHEMARRVAVLALQPMGSQNSRGFGKAHGRLPKGCLPLGPKRNWIGASHNANKEDQEKFGGRHMGMILVIRAL